MNNTRGKQLGFCKSDQPGRMLHACVAREREREREREGAREKESERERERGGGTGSFKTESLPRLVSGVSAPFNSGFVVDSHLPL